MAFNSGVRKGVLSPAERFAEILFGLIMTLSFTGTMSVISGGRQEVTTTLISVLGCNIAWGIIDGILYLIAEASERGNKIALFDYIRGNKDEEEARRAIEETLPPLVAGTLQPGELESIRQRLLKVPEPASRRLLAKEDFLGALAVFLFVVASCLPVIFPFLIVRDPLLALRTSNGVALGMLFLGGYFLAKYSGTPRIPTGLAMVALGVVMVGITIALGG
jgi:VIT1/CCC1 family predicted Fe2+/Mn2+ transporter